MKGTRMWKPALSVPEYLPSRSTTHACCCGTTRAIREIRIIANTPTTTATMKEPMQHHRRGGEEDQLEPERSGRTESDEDRHQKRADGKESDVSGGGEELDDQQNKGREDPNPPSHERVIERNTSCRLSVPGCRLRAPLSLATSLQSVEQLRRDGRYELDVIRRAAG